MTTEFFEKAKSHLDRNETDQAINALLDHLDTCFGDVTAIYMLGGAFLAKSHPGLGAILTRAAIELKVAAGRPEFPEAFMNLGSCFRLAHDKNAAKEIWKIGLAQETLPYQKARFYGCLGTAHINEGDPEPGVRYLDQGLALAPNDGTLRYNRGLAHLELGNWQQGWADYEQGFRSGDRRGRRYGDLPGWDGSSGKRVIVWGEQGIGDEIMFASCLPDLIEVSEGVTFDCHPRLVALFERSFPGVSIYGTRKQQSGVDWLLHTEADAHVCVSSLPMFFRNRDEDFPGTAYLKADRQSLLVPSSDQHSPTRKPRIGLSWAGGTHKTRMDLRSIPLKQWEPILRSVDADFYSLQYTDTAAREVCEFEEMTGVKVKHYPGWVECRDYDRTASFVASMDLVVTVNTTIHHLAGAVGVPCWTLTPSKPAWRYGVSGEKCPWYGSVKLIRQKMGDDWTPVIAEVASDLRHRFAA